jgi:hypothetical protein
LAAAHSGGRGASTELIDLRRGTRRTLASRPADVKYGAGRVLVFGAGLRGLTAYRPNGRRAFRLLSGRRIDSLPVRGRFAYAVERRRVTVIDLRRGRVVSRSGPPPGQFFEFLAPGA